MIGNNKKISFIFFLFSYKHEIDKLEKGKI